MTQHTKKKKKKRRSRAPKPSPTNSRDHEQNEQQQQTQRETESKILHALMEPFDSVSLEDAPSAYKEADGDVNKAMEILANAMDNSEDPSTSSVSSGIWSSDWGLGSSSSSSSYGSSLDGFVKGFRGRSNKQKRVVAVTGTVSTVLGKEYVKASPRRDSVKAKELFGNFNGNGGVDKGVAEQFLCSMLGTDCELSLAVVRDVLCGCGYDVEQALDALLDLSASSYKQSRNSKSLNDSLHYREYDGFIVEHSYNLRDRESDCTSHSSESELYDSIWGYDCRNYLQALKSSKAPSLTSLGSNVSDLPQKVLESLFNISKSSEHEPSTMNWSNVVKKMQSLGPGVDVCPSSGEGPKQDIHAKGDEYHQFRNPAKQHWESMRSYYQKAAAAYSKGQREYAAYLSDQGKVKTKLAREAEEKASKDIFKARNKGIENAITIDLHGQHVKQAMRLLKIHLLFGTYACSVKTLRVITGCGSHGVGKSKLKQSVIKLLENEGIEWSEENRGTVLIKLDGQKEYSFPDSESDTE